MCNRNLYLEIRLVRILHPRSCTREALGLRDEAFWRRSEGLGCSLGWDLKECAGPDGLMLAGSPAETSCVAGWLVIQHVRIWSRVITLAFFLLIQSHSAFHICISSVFHPICTTQVTSTSLRLENASEGSSLHSSNTSHSSKPEQYSK